MNTTPRRKPETNQNSLRVDVNLTRAILISVAFVIVLAACVRASEMVLILFLAGLFAVFLSNSADWMSGILPVPRGWCLAILVSVLILAMIGGTASFFVQINQQISQASDRIDEGVDQLRDWVKQYPAARSTLKSIPMLSDVILTPEESSGLAVEGEGSKPANARQQDSVEVESSMDENDSEAPSIPSLPEPVRRAVSSIGQLFQTTFGLVINSLLIFFVGLFLAASPAVYRDGIIKLVPKRRRERIEEVLYAVGNDLWRWLIGRFGSMFVTGFGAFLLLWLIGVPMAATLGIVTGLLTFVPNVGAAVALMLAILCALPEGLTTAGMVLAAYLALQLFESYVVTPLIQQQQVSLPPALLIAFQAIMGVLFGFHSAAVASPLLAATKKSVELLYVEDYLAATDSVETAIEVTE